MNIQTLENIGLTKNQAKVYVLLLKIGYSTVIDVAKEGRMHRTNVYDALYFLIQNGLANNIVKNSTRYFTAADPDNLMKMMKQKEQSLIRLLPQLRLHYKLNN